MQRPSVHNKRMMRSGDDCGKGNLPKLKVTHILEAGTVLNKCRTVM